MTTHDNDKAHDAAEMLRKVLEWRNPNGTIEHAYLPPWLAKDARSALTASEAKVRDAALEEAAKVCDQSAQSMEHNKAVEQQHGGMGREYHYQAVAYRQAARVICALKSSPPEARQPAVSLDGKDGV